VKRKHVEHQKHALKDVFLVFDMPNVSKAHPYGVFAYVQQEGKGEGGYVGCRLSKGQARPGPTHFCWPLALTLEGQATLTWPWPSTIRVRPGQGRVRADPGPAIFISLFILKKNLLYLSIDIIFISNQTL
jgi:hypothetical protein